MLLQDARIYQLLFLALFLLLGIGTRDWTLHPGMIAIVILTCVLTQTIAESVVYVLKSRQQVAASLPPCQAVQEALPAQENAPKRDGQTLLQTLPAKLPSALITSLGLSLLLRADHYSTLMLAGILAILSKFLLRFKEKHIFNPANFGILSVLILTPDAWVSPGQWGDEGWYALLFLGTGGVVLRKVGRWDTTIAFLSTYAGLEALRNLWLGWTWDVLAHRLMSGSLLLFALFMVTDPRTIPNARSGRLIWAAAIALLTFILRNGFFLSTAVFWALFALAPLTILLDQLLPAPGFAWTENPDPQPADADSLDISATPASLLRSHSLP